MHDSKQKQKRKKKAKRMLKITKMTNQRFNKQCKNTPGTMHIGKNTNTQHNKIKRINFKEINLKLQTPHQTSSALLPHLSVALDSLR